MSGLMSASKDNKTKSNKAYATASVVPWDGVEAQVSSGGNAVISAVATPIAMNNGAAIAEREQTSYEVVSCRVVGSASSPQPSLLESGVDINYKLLNENERKARESMRQEEANLRQGNKMSASEIAELKQLRQAEINARNRIREEERNINIGNRSAIASTAEGEKSVLRIQVPMNATPGMLLTVDMPDSKKGDSTNQITVTVPVGAKPGGMIEVIVTEQDSDEAAILAKMERLRLEAEERVRLEAEQEEYSYKGMGDGEYEYTPENQTPRQEPEEEYTYGG